MSKAKKATTKRVGEEKPADDKALIAAMLQYGAAIGTALTICKLEPGGNCDRSGPLAERAFSRGYDALHLAAALPAQTMEGLSAKARAVPFIFQDNESGVLGAANEEFICSLAADAQRLAEQVIAAKGGAA